MFSFFPVFGVLYKKQWKTTYTLKVNILCLRISFTCYQWYQNNCFLRYQSRYVRLIIIAEHFIPYFFTTKWLNSGDIKRLLIFYISRWCLKNSIHIYNVTGQCLISMMTILFYSAYSLLVIKILLNNSQLCLSDHLWRIPVFCYFFLTWSKMLCELL